MTSLEQEIIQVFKSVYNKMGELNSRLVTAGFEKDDAQEWMFNIEDWLGDWERGLTELVQICDTTDLDQAPRLLDSWSGDIRYGTNPHSEDHLKALEAALKKYLPPTAYDDEDK